MSEEAKSEDMKSIGELLAEGGWRPKPPREYTAEDYARITASHWENHKGKIWNIMRGRGVPEQFVSTLERGGANETPAIIQVERFLRGEKNANLMLVLWGDPQVGKSFACAYGISTQTTVHHTQYGNEPWLDYRYPSSDFEWVRAGSLSGLKDHRFDNETRTRYQAMERCRLLVLDELGGPSWDAKATSSIVLDLLGKRWDAQRRTIITTNLHPDSLGGELDDRIIDRIKRVGRVVEVGGLGQT